MPNPQHKSFDPRVSIADQLQFEAGPIVMINTFVVAPEDVGSALDFYARSASIMRRQPGCISAQLHLAIGGAGVMVNYAVWESVEQLRAAVRNPEFIVANEMAPAGAIAYPVLLQRVAVPGVCVA